MRSLLLVLTVVVPLAAWVPLAASDHCEGYSTEPTWADTGPSPAGQYYLDIDVSQFEPLSIWIYEESNGLPGLQRGDEVVDGTCHGSIPADRIVF